MSLSLLEIVIRIALTFALSFTYGIHRQKSNKPIGFGTYSFVSVGSAALGITATTLSPENPLPLLGAIVTGIGFLGAGALIRTNTDRIFGFMNAASIWLFSILGLIVGTGEYFLAAIIYAIMWLVTYTDVYLENRGIGSYQKRFTITTNKFIDEKDIRSAMAKYGTRNKMLTAEIDKKNNKLVIAYLVEGSKESINKLAQHLYKESWFEASKIE